MENCKIISIDDGCAELIVYYKDDNISRVYCRECGHDGLTYYIGNDVKFDENRFTVLYDNVEKRSGIIVN